MADVLDAVYSPTLLAPAIQTQEGWFPGSRSYRNNNPGNIKFGPFAISQGANSQDDQGHAIFPSYDAGRVALINLLGSKYSGQTLRQIGSNYAQDANWASGVGNILANNNFGAVSSNSADKGGLMPMNNGAVNPPQTNQDSSDSGGLLSGVDWSNIGPTLMALGAGIAGGSQQGWGPGIGAGLTNATNLLQTRLSNQFKLAELMNTLRHQGLEEQLGIVNASTKANRDAGSRAITLARLGAGSGAWQKSVDVLTNPDSWTLGSQAAEAARAKVGGVGPVTDAQNAIKSIVEGAVGHPLSAEEAVEFVPQWGDPADTRASKIAYASDLAKSALGAALQTATPDARAKYNPNAFDYTGAGQTPPPPNANPSASSSVPKGQLSASMTGQGSSKAYATPPVSGAMRVKDKNGTPLWYDPKSGNRWLRQ